MQDVYQVVNEDEYSDIVRKRQEEDWVIDDGEEVIYADLLFWSLVLKMVTWDSVQLVCTCLGMLAKKIACHQQKKALSLSADQLAQLVEFRTTVREVVGSNPVQTNTQGL